MARKASGADQPEAAQALLKKAKSAVALSACESFVHMTG